MRQLATTRTAHSNSRPTSRRVSALAWLLLTALALLAPFAAPAYAQSAGRPQPASRIAAAIDASSHVALAGTVSPRIQSKVSGAVDQGLVAGNLQLNGMTLVFAPTAAQQADLKQLLIDQQTPGSSSYHQWLTPAQYAARFGVSDADIAKVENWLTAAGFTVQGVNNSHTRITFSGNAAQVESAFATELHHYTVDGETHLANATPIQVPSALAGMVTTVGNLTDFRLKPHVRRMPPVLAPKYTSSQSGSIFVTPPDLDVIYDIAPLYSAGYTGTGRRIAIVGQSAILDSDIANFRSAAGLTANPPVMVLVPNTGISTINPIADGDEVESDLDVEYSGAIAQNATIYFVYTGSNGNGVDDALSHAIDTNIAPIVSISYGLCEQELASGEFTAREQVLAQANSQGQTIFSASGDTGATDCDDGGSTSPITSATHGLAVDYPAASQYVTGVGGTMFNDASSTSTYWSTTNTADGGSALGYVPEEVWNESTTAISEGYGLSSGGGGASILTAKPSWQTGTGVPSDGKRDVPDISLHAASGHEPYLYCSSDSTYTGVTGSCSNGFRDVNDEYFTAAGGTSFAAPISAAIFTLIEQKAGSNGEGNLNPELYALAASNPSAFHDITVGNNSQPCTIGSTGCTSSPIGFAAGVGYDQATGLGTLDANMLAGAFPAATTSSLIATTVALTPANPTLTAGSSASQTITATVTPATGAGTPTGTVQFAVDGASSGSAVTLSGSIATFSVPSSVLSQSGSHVISATYSGDTTYATSYGVDTLTVNPAASSGTGSIALSGTTATAPLGGTGTSTITITPSGGYTGTVAFTLSTSSTAVENDSCYDINNASVSGTAAVSTTLTFYTSTSLCSSASFRNGDLVQHFKWNATQSSLKTIAANQPNNRKPGFPATPISAAAIAGALCLFTARRHSRLWMLAAVVLLSGAALGSIGCGGSSGTPITTTTTDLPAGNYSIGVTATDTTYAAITTTTTITLTVQ